MRAQWIVSAAMSLLAAATLFRSSPASAQQPNIGIAPVAWTDTPYVFDTAEQHKVRVVLVMRGLKHPFALALLPNGDALISERGAALRVVHSRSRSLDDDPLVRGVVAGQDILQSSAAPV